MSENASEIKYEVVFCANIYELGTEVSRRLNTGWELAGNAFLAREGGLYQPMVYYPTLYNQKRLDEVLSEIADYACAT